MGNTPQQEKILAEWKKVEQLFDDMRAGRDTPEDFNAKFFYVKDKMTDRERKRHLAESFQDFQVFKDELENGEIMRVFVLSALWWASPDMTKLQLPK